jgi:hypothetical protein
MLFSLERRANTTMICDPDVLVLCDSKDCKGQILVCLSSEDTTRERQRRAVEDQIPTEGWLVQKGRHYCPDCAQDL